ncbi:MAG: hypothetical protein ACLKAO_08710 [Alkaliphilus sp.]
MMQRRYKRYFVMLESEDKGFEKFKDENPKGYAKVEIKNGTGIINISCQNLRKLELNKKRYRCYLINTEKKPIVNIVDIGPLEVDDKGYGELAWQFNPQNVKATREEIDNFDVLLVIAEKVEGSRSLEVALVGYMNKEKTQWRSLVEKKMYGIEKDKDIRVLNVKNEVLKEEKKALKEKQGLKQEPKQEIKQEASIKERETFETSATEKEIEKKSDKREAKTLNSSDSAKKEKSDWASVVHMYIISNLEMFPKTTLLDNHLSNYEWWRINYNYYTIYTEYMPYIAYIEAAKYPTHYNPYHHPAECHRMIYDYQHYMFGIAYDEKRKVVHYVYAIPGKKTKADQPYEGKTGFTHWCSSKNSREETFGYWLLHIDAKTGKVVNPLASNTFSEE